MQRKAPAGCFWRGDTLWGRIYINGREIRRSLQTNDAKIAAKRRQAAQERVIADKFGDATRDFVEVMEAWSQWITRAGRPQHGEALCVLARPDTALPRRQDAVRH